MQSNGGILYADAVLRKPAAIVESGPAAGVIGAAQTAPRSGYPNVISLDMGGTTAKASMVEDGAVVKTSEFEVGAGINLSSKLAMGGGHALKLPVIDVSEIGAGGGSIVAVDRHGRLQVGPQSAGAVPGPVCYDTGGESATLTDALVALGYLNPAYLVGGEMRLNAEKARRALREQVAAPLGRDLHEAAHGVQVVAGATMMRAVKAVSTYRGRDPRDFDLFAFGGSGPVLATEVARQLGMRRVIVPPNPGLFSAFGLLLSNIEHEFVRTYFRRSTEVGAKELADIFETLEAQARAALASDGFEPAQMTIVRQADLRYSGQAYELTVPVGGNGTGAAGTVDTGATDTGVGDTGVADTGAVDTGPADTGPADIDVADIVEAFGEEHLRTYGHRAEDEPVDLVSVRVVGRAEPIGPRALDPRAAVRGRAGSAEPEARARTRAVYFGAGHGSLQTPGGGACGALVGRDAGAADRRGVRCDLGGPAGLARLPRPGGQHRDRNRMKRDADRTRPRHLRSHQERAGLPGRRDGPGAHAQRPLRGLPRLAGLLDGRVRRAGEDGRAGAHDADAHGDVPPRHAHADRAVGRRHAPRRHLHHQRPLRRRRAAPARHLRDEADLPRRPHRGVRGDAGPPYRHRRHHPPGAPRSTPPRSTRKGCASRS